MVALVTFKRLLQILEQLVDSRWGPNKALRFLRQNPHVVLSASNAARRAAFAPRACVLSSLCVHLFQCEAFRFSSDLLDVSPRHERLFSLDPILAHAHHPRTGQHETREERIESYEEEPRHGCYQCHLREQGSSLPQANKHERCHANKYPSDQRENDLFSWAVVPENSEHSWRDHTHHRPRRAARLSSAVTKLNTGSLSTSMRLQRHRFALFSRPAAVAHRSAAGRRLAPSYVDWSSQGTKLGRD